MEKVWEEVWGRKGCGVEGRERARWGKKGRGSGGG